MNALFKIIILFSAICFISAANSVSSPSTDNAKNKLTVLYKTLDSTEEVKPNLNNKNYGDLIVGEKQDKDILLYREIFMNNKTAYDQYFVMKTSSDKYKFRNIRFFNIGRQIGYQYGYSLVNKSKLEIKFTVNKTEEAHIWIEIYGYNGSSTILSSGLLLIITNIIYQLIK